MLSQGLSGGKKGEAGRVCTRHGGVCVCVSKAGSTLFTIPRAFCAPRFPVLWDPAKLPLATRSAFLSSGICEGRSVGVGVCGSLVSKGFVGERGTYAAAGPWQNAVDPARSTQERACSGSSHLHPAGSSSRSRAPACEQQLVRVLFPSGIELTASANEEGGRHV